MANFWNIKQIAQELEDSYALCRSDFERCNWRAINAKEIRSVIGNRRLTPGEQAILDKYKLVL